MPAALIIGQLVATHGIPLAIELVKMWKREREGDQPTPDEWLALFNSPSIKLSYDEHIAAARARAGQ